MPSYALRSETTVALRCARTPVTEQSDSDKLLVIGPLRADVQELNVEGSGFCELAGINLFISHQKKNIGVFFF